MGSLHSFRVAIKDISVCRNIEHLVGSPHSEITDLALLSDIYSKLEILVRKPSA
jgi:hypothetical protein